MLPQFLLLRLLGIWWLSVLTLVGLSDACSFLWSPGTGVGKGVGIKGKGGEREGETGGEGKGGEGRGREE